MGVRVSVGPDKSMSQKTWHRQLIDIGSLSFPQIKKRGVFDIRLEVTVNSIERRTNSYKVDTNTTRL